MQQHILSCMLAMVSDAMFDGSGIIRAMRFFAASAYEGSDSKALGGAIRDLRPLGMWSRANRFDCLAL